jgi:hypothetical protein
LVATARVRENEWYLECLIKSLLDRGKAILKLSGQRVEPTVYRSTATVGFKITLNLLIMTGNDITGRH